MSTATSVSEVERKYEATSEQQLPALSGLPGVDGEPRRDTVQLSALYYDTGELLLLRAGITLRRREGGDDAGWHLKIPAGADERTELQLEPDAGHPETEVPREFAELLTAVTRGAALNPVALISTDRERQRLVDAAGTTLAEVVSDVVIAAVPEAGTGSDERVWREIEVELAAGDRNLFDAIDSRLTDAGITRSDAPSKLRRALGDAVTGTPRPARGKKSAPRTLLLEYLAAQKDSLVTADLGVRRDLEESVHDLRVAARRIRSILQVYGADLRDQQTVDELIVELRWVGQALSSARDTEVQWSRLVDRLGGAEEIPDREVVRARLDEYFSGLAATARPAALAALNSQRYLDLLAGLDTFLAAVEASEGTGPSKKKVAKSLRTMSKSVRKRVRKATAATSRGERDELTHRARKRAKRMRYAIESTRSLAPKASDRAHTKFKGFQDVLGEYQDAVVARDHILAMVAEDQHSAESSLGLGMLLQRELDRGDTLAPQLKPEWKTARKAARKVWK
ncbi:CYTH and CHAD domain-containing protein [Rhodococcus jostii]|uniref:CHAD domain-containing protein n=1 Tax=Rhodococcus jostii TaxID=132919 RepID=A0A1H4Z301_RHOJO|nr:CYTH and CHAD domain-containing protein [Rhodococcus jostii]SED24592.1 CHAD domain-containing protein [Rhodococcus jostii]